MLASLVGDLGTANDDFARRAARLLQRCRAVGRSSKMNADTPQRARTGHGGDRSVPPSSSSARTTRAGNAHEVAVARVVVHEEPTNQEASSPRAVMPAPPAAHRAPPQCAPRSSMASRGVAGSSPRPVHGTAAFVTMSPRAAGCPHHHNQTTGTSVKAPDSARREVEREVRNFEARHGLRVAPPRHGMDGGTQGHGAPAGHAHGPRTRLRARPAIGPPPSFSGYCADRAAFRRPPTPTAAACAHAWRMRSHGTSTSAYRAPPAAPLKSRFVDGIDLAVAERLHSSLFRGDRGAPERGVPRAIPSYEHAAASAMMQRNQFHDAATRSPRAGGLSTGARVDDAVDVEPPVVLALVGRGPSHDAAYMLNPPGASGIDGQPAAAGRGKLDDDDDAAALRPPIRRLRPRTWRGACNPTAGDKSEAEELAAALSLGDAGAAESARDNDRAAYVTITSSRGLIAAPL